MQPEHDESAFDWIRRGRKKADPDLEVRRSVGYFVSLLMPPAFEAYAKILHRLKGHYENIDNPLSPGEIAILKIPPCAEIISLVESKRDSPQGPRVKWREVAEVLNIPFASEINIKWFRKQMEDGCWSRFLYGPIDGWLFEEECDELVSVLKPFMDGGECFFRFSEWRFFGTGKPLLFHGALDELSEFRRTSGYQISPEYWWPPGQGWCVCSDYDHAFTIVGGSRELISTLLTSSVLECLKVTPQTRIDYFVPMP